MSDALSLRISVAASARRRLAIEAAFEVPPGVTILFGPSGAGKSTLLSAIAGLLRPAAGRIALGGEVWFDAAAGLDLEPHRRGLSIVFQSLALFPHLTALGNVEYGLPRALPAAARRAQAQGALERMKVGHLDGRKPRTFSGGEAQRVALARALARSPRVLLLDEAFSATDAPLRAGLHAEVAALVAELRIPTLQVTHDRAEAKVMGSRVVLLDQGRVVGQGGLELLG